MIVFYILMILIFSLFLFPNIISYTILLLFFRVSILFLLASHSFLRILLFLMVIIVYVGAMIILIGYICAICPNPILSLGRKYSFFLVLFFLISLLSLLIISSSFSLPPLSLPPIGDYFYSSFGVFMFLLIILFLCFTLLIVTSYYLSSKGPLRSVN